jgi:hypothetical protein
MGWFQQAFNTYWHKEGMNRALSAFLHVVTTEKQFQEIMEAIRQQAPEMLQKEPEYRPLMSGC